MAEDSVLGIRSQSMVKDINRTLWLTMLLRLSSILCLLAACAIHAAEEQAHGVAFEQWVRDTFFDGYQRRLTLRRGTSLLLRRDKRHGGIPADPKATKFWGMPHSTLAMRCAAVKRDRGGILLAHRRFLSIKSN